MAKRRDSTMQNEYLESMIKNLPVLRASINLTQEQLGMKLGVSRQTVVAIENGKNSLTWSLYLAMVCIFQQHGESMILLNGFNIFDPDFIKKL